MPGEAMQRALEAAGVELIAENGGNSRAANAFG